MWKKIKVNGTLVPTPIKLKRKVEKYDIKSADTKLVETVKIAPTMPSQWHDALKEKNRFKENYDVGEIDYNRVYREKSSSWKKIKNKSLLIEDLPIRLYDLEKEKIIEIGKDTNINDYVILSYSWGGEGSKELKWSVNNANDKLSLGGKKSLAKAKDACYHLKIDYLWVDQLCINQDDPQEKNQEVPKMRQYYGNATVTLVAIHTNILDDDNKELSPSPDDVVKKIISSPWFSRSWTYQEGWLSKQTLFMFDDALVDGRDLAQFWASHQPLLTRRLTGEYKEGLVKIATPIGWVYYQDGYDLEKDKKVDINLSEVLREIKNRGRGISIDGIYSILGLLPYGDKVVPEYRETEHKYTKKELQEALFGIMNTAAENGYGEIFAWHGEGKYLVPEIDVEKGSTSVVGGIVINCTSNKLYIEPDGVIKINGSDYFIEDVGSDTKPLEERGGFLIEGGLYAKTALVKVNNNSESVMLVGTREVLAKMKKDNILIVLNKDEWNSSKLFAILAFRKGKVYYRIGLVELESGGDKLKGNEERKLSIAAMNIEETDQQLETQIQIPPK